MKAIDLFCGCGGMSLGFQNAGIQVLSAYDNWEPAINVYSKNFDHPVYRRDLSDLSVCVEIAGQKPDLIFGGPPCQDFSTAGHMDESLGRAHLSICFAKIIEAVRPRFFVMENVAQAQKSKSYNAAIEILRQSGYALTRILLDASYCGVPQTRKRYFAIGDLKGQEDFLKESLLSKLSSKPMSIHDYLGDSLGVEYYFRVPTNYSRRGVYSIYEPSQTIRGVDRPIPKGYRRHPEDPVEIGPLVRALTVKERSLIQTFPESFVFEGTKTDLNQMIGNAVPVKLAEYVASCLLLYANEGGD